MCIQTIYIRKYQQEVPCGKCYECVKRRRNDWYIRCAIEAKDSKYTYFGLLTYSHVSDKLEKRDVQLFLKRLRSYGYVFKYLIAGEHGEKNDRPHWHVLLFTNEPIIYQRVAQAWRGGYRNNQDNVSGWINFELIRSLKSIRYTVKYLYKYVGIDPRFVLMVSKNPAIGHSYLEKQALYLRQKTAKFRLNGVPMALPRYYKRKFFDDYPDIKEEVNSALADKVKELADAELEAAKVHYPGYTLAQIKRAIKESKFRYHEQSQR